MKVGYLTGEYPRATDTFIQREILAVERCGVEVERFAVRRPGDEHMVGEQQRSERDRTTYLLEQPCSEIVRAVAGALVRSPRRFVGAVRLAVSTRRLGAKGAGKQVAYFAEAAILADLMRRRGVDHLHNHFADSSCTVAMLSDALGGHGYSFTLHGPSIFFEPYEWHLGRKLETARFCSAISSFARSQASLFSSPEVWDRIRIVHCGVGEPPALPSTPRDDSTCRLLFVGRLDQVKGVVVLFDAVAAMLAGGGDGDASAVHLTLVGDGPQRADLERRTRELGIESSVVFAGYRNQDEVQQHLADCDVFVLPSFAEGVPVSLMEAMAVGRPVVATNVGGVTELVRDGDNGVVVAPGDADVLRAALGSLAADPVLRERLGAAGRETVRADFDSETEARRLVTLFRDPGHPSPSSVRPVPAADAR